jgi:hypothetical protein
MRPEPGRAWLSGTLIPPLAPLWAVTGICSCTANTVALRARPSRPWNTLVAVPGGGGLTRVRLA